MSLKANKNAKCVLIVSIKHGKLSLPETRICQYCQTQFEALYHQSKFCSIICRRKAMWAKRKTNGYNKNWEKNHKAERMVYRRRMTKKLNSLWYGTVEQPAKGCTNHTTPRLIQAEQSAESVLRSEGFNQITWTRDFSAFFPCDYLAERNGQKYGIEVTTQYQRAANRRIVPLLQFFGLKLLILHIRPDLTKYYLREPKGKHKLFSSVEKELMEEYKNV